MSFAPYMKYKPRSGAQQIVTFGGLNYGTGGSDGEFSQTLNLSSRMFPALSQRRGRTVEKKYESATALYAKEKLLVVDGTNVMFGDETVGQVEAGEKIIASVNSKILIFPDKKYYDTEKKEFGDMAVKLSVERGNIQYSTDFITITGTAQSLDKLFAKGQAIEISGSSISANNKTFVIRDISGNKLKFSANSVQTGTENNTVTVERKVPDFSCICESANRLWGAENNTIYASALGDPLTFYNYEGLATDAFAVSVGTDGDFTGCVGYSANVLFFKENALHKVLGSIPSEYRVYDYTVPGVQAGSQKSIVVINEILYYKGVSGVYAYSGATPYLLTEKFGTRRFEKATGGTDGVKYYVSMKNAGEEVWNLFVYDTAANVWLREDSSHVIDFARQDTKIHALFADDKSVYLLDQETEELTPWEAVFYPFDDTTYGKRGYSKLWIRMELSPGAWIKAEISMDGGPFRQVGLWSNSEQHSGNAEIFPGRCDIFQLKLSGEGDCVMKSLVREFIVNSTY